MVFVEKSLRDQGRMLGAKSLLISILAGGIVINRNCHAMSSTRLKTLPGLLPAMSITYFVTQKKHEQVNLIIPYTERVVVCQRQI
jgi:hypothetical protein